MRVCERFGVDCGFAVVLVVTRRMLRKEDVQMRENLLAMQVGNNGKTRLGHHTRFFHLLNFLMMVL